MPSYLVIKATLQFLRKIRRKVSNTLFKFCQQGGVCLANFVFRLCHPFYAAN
jgi:hypothetical protein